MFAFLEVEAYFNRGNREAERRVVDGLGHAERPNDPMLLSRSGVEAVLGGRTAEARQILDRMEALRARQYIDGSIAMPVCAALEDRKQLLLWLGRQRRTVFYGSCTGRC